MKAVLLMQCAQLHRAHQHPLTGLGSSERGRRAEPNQRSMTAHEADLCPRDRRGEPQIANQRKIEAR